jgi:hypothetical protein
MLYAEEGYGFEAEPAIIRGITYHKTALYPTF